MTLNCTECERLWLLHSEALRVHIKIVWLCHQASNHRDRIGLDSLKPSERSAASVRRAARVAATAHEATHHVRKANGHAQK
jgi:hypothetical protein